MTEIPCFRPGWASQSVRAAPAAPFPAAVAHEGSLGMFGVLCARVRGAGGWQWNAHGCARFGARLTAAREAWMMAGGRRGAARTAPPQTEPVVRRARGARQKNARAHAVRRPALHPESAPPDYA